MEDERITMGRENIKNTWEPIKNAYLFGVPLELLNKDELLRAVNAAVHGITWKD